MISLIILEDDPAHFALIQRVLTTNVFTNNVLTTSTPANTAVSWQIHPVNSIAAFRELIQHKVPDIVLMDLRLGDGTALGILNSMTERTYPVVVMTSGGDEETAVQAIKAGALDYFIKSPENIASIPRILTRTLREWALIEDQKKQEAERLEMERNLQHAQKLESLGILAGGIAHDFNNLLMAMMGNLDLALNDSTLNSKTRTWLQQAVQAAERAADLTKQMLAYAGKGQFLIEKLDLSTLINQNLALFRSCIDKSIRFETALAEGLPSIAVDASQLYQVAVNLITNADESIENKTTGKVTLRTGQKEVSVSELADSFVTEKPAAGRFVFLEVTDNGCGMPGAMLEKMFDPFFTTKFLGRGLGLSAVLGIVRAHKGAIFIDSEPGQGTRIQVLFPAIQAAEIPADTGTVKTPELPAVQNLPDKAATILIVDDENIVRLSCEALLIHLGYQVLTATDGRKALEVLAEKGAAVQGVILDLMMPNMDGVATFTAIADRFPDMPVLISSGYSEQEVQSRFENGPAPKGYILKPYHLGQLRTLLSQILQAAAGGIQDTHDFDK